MCAGSPGLVDDRVERLGEGAAGSERARPDREELGQLGLELPLAAHRPEPEGGDRSGQAAGEADDAGQKAEEGGCGEPAGRGAGGGREGDVARRPHDPGLAAQAIEALPRPALTQPGLERLRQLEHEERASPRGARAAFGRVLREARRERGDARAGRSAHDERDHADRADAEHDHEHAAVGRPEARRSSRDSRRQGDAGRAPAAHPDVQGAGARLRQADVDRVGGREPRLRELKRDRLKARERAGRGELAAGRRRDLAERPRLERRGRLEADRVDLDAGAAQAVCQRCERRRG